MAMADTPPPAAAPLLAAALAYARRGWHVFPLYGPGRATLCSCGDAACSAPAKHPRTRNGWKEATTDERRIREWWRKWPTANVGVATGPSRLVVLDVDPRHGGDGAVGELARRHSGERMVSGVVEALVNTLTSDTGGGGQHYLYVAPEGLSVRNKTNLDGLSGLDVRGDGGYIVAPPSMHTSGARYQWRDASLAVAEIPAWLLPVLRQRDSQPLRAPTRMFPAREGEDPRAFWLERALAMAREGNRNERGFWLACQLRDDGVPQAEADVVMAAYAARVPGAGYSEREALQSLRSAYRTAAREAARSQAPQMAQAAQAAMPAPAQRLASPEISARNITHIPQPAEPPPDEKSEETSHRTDMGNARRFVAKHGRDTRYVAQWGQWLLWDETRYQRDLTDGVVRMAKDTTKSIYGEAAQCDDPDERREVVKWALKSESEARLRAMLSLAESEPEIAIAPDALDADGWGLNAVNGYVDLRSGKLLPHDRAHLATKRAGAGYDPKARRATWLAFLDTIFGADVELIAYIQRAVGYSLTGDTTEQCVFVGHGTGANGKSTFIDTLCSVLGDYAMTTPTDTLMAKNGQTIPSDVARLVGARFVAASESGEGRRLDEELVKRISGGDRMAARFMHKDWFEFTPVLKLWLAVNHEPTIRGTDNGIWRRIHLIPFTVTIPPEQQDKRMAEKLLAERDGILAWAVEGCLAWQRGGLRPPEKVQQATKDYRTRMDTFGQFLDECCELDRREQVSNKALRQRYENWCEENGERPMAQVRVSRLLRERGIASVRSEANGATSWLGVGLKSTFA